jgi:hypothetical protein
VYLGILYANSYLFFSIFSPNIKRKVKKQFQEFLRLLHRNVTVWLFFKKTNEVLDCLKRIDATFGIVFYTRQVEKSSTKLFLFCEGLITRAIVNAQRK